MAYSHEPPLITFVDLKEVVEEAMNLVPMNHRDDIAIEIDRSIDDSGKVRASRLLLLQVLQNLLTNAIEAVGGADESPKTIIVECHVERIDGDDMVRLVVRDTGVGIDSTELEAIFQSGFSTKTDGRGGLGLHWCANTVNRMNGKIFAESAGPGRGAQLNVLLPRAA